MWQCFVTAPTLLCPTPPAQAFPDHIPFLQVLNQVSISLAVFAFLLVIGIFVAAIVRGKGVGYAFIISFVVYVSVVPIGIPVVTGTVLAVGAREMAKEKAIVSR